MPNYARLLVSSLIALLTVLGSACSDDDTGGPDAEQETKTSSKTVDSSGGTIEVGAVTVKFPDGALDEPTEITVTKTSQRPPDTYQQTTSLYRFEPEATTFNKPVTVTFERAEADGSAIYWSRREGSGYAQLPTTTQENAVQGRVTHFSSGFVGRQQVCSSDDDCPDFVPCTGGTCGRSMGSCRDGTQNGSETDVDCGGSVCPSCKIGQSCERDRDCLSGTCGSDSVCETGKVDVGVDADTSGDTAAEETGTDADAGGTSSRLAWLDLIGTPEPERGFGVAFAGSNAVYMTGQTKGELAGGGRMDSDRFATVSKYDTSGNRQWLDVMDSPEDSSRNSEAVGRDVAAGAGEAFVVGEMRGTLNGVESNDGPSGFVTKYDSSGGRLWTRLINNEDEPGGGQFVKAVALGDSNRLYVTGVTNETLGGGTFNGGQDVFVIALDRSGTPLWTRILGSSDSQDVNGIATNGSGEIYVAGSTDGDLGGETQTGFREPFLAKYDASGTRQWVRVIEGSEPAYSRGIDVGPSGSVYLVGFAERELAGKTSGGGKDAFIAAYDRTGNRKWVRMAGTSKEDVGAGVAVESASRIYLLRRTDRGFGVETGGKEDVFVDLFDASGRQQSWTHLLGTPEDDRPNGVAADGSGTVFVTGTTDGDLGGQTNSGGQGDAFLGAVK